MNTAQVMQSSQAVQTALTPSVKKHAGAIHIKNDISCLQRKVWNVLLLNAYEELPDNEVFSHSIRVKDLMALAGFDSKNVKYLKDALEDMVTTKIMWDIIDANGKNEWGVTTALASATIKEGVCTYAYSHALRTKLYNPELYARIDLLTISRFNSGHALALYENCARYRAIRQTPVFPLRVFRDLLGVGSSAYYDEFKQLNRKVIQPAIKEINTVSDIQIDVELQREKRKVVGVKFLIQENNQGLLSIDSPTSFNTALITRLQESFLLTEAQAKESLALHSEDRIEAVMSYVADRYRDGKIRNGSKALAPYFLKILKEGDIAPLKTNLDESPKITNAPVQAGLLEDDLQIRREYNSFRKQKVDEYLSGLSQEQREELNHDFEKTLVGQRLIMKKWREYLDTGEGSAMVVNGFYQFIANRFLPDYEAGLQVFQSIREGIKT